MVGVREHVYRLNGLHFIFRIEQLQVARLRSRITADRIRCVWVRQTE